MASPEVIYTAEEEREADALRDLIRELFEGDEQ